jgi:predicted CXXCH cytochrome family protein
VECHDDFQKVMKRKHVHGAAEDKCTNCHNPHNASQPILLTQELVALCVSCHDDQKTQMTKMKVVHGALTTGKKCVGCHNPHASDVKPILIQLAGDLCISCHATDTITDAGGKPLTNFKKLLDANSEQHAPVATKDCSACHKAHASQNFRLLAKEYPPQFYSTYATNLYALCYECHDPKLAADPETTTLTQFRNGSKNLHYVHVNKSERGRTCRACHEVHAAKQAHIIRDGVPYGSAGWILKVNYTKTPTGGSCAKTCHGEQVYARGPATKVQGKPATEKPPAEKANAPKTN